MNKSYDCLQFMDLLNRGDKSHEQLEQILFKMQQLNYFNQFVKQYFRGSCTEDLLRLCSELTMEQFQGGEIIIKKGEQSNDKLYIIFFGSVFMMKSQNQKKIIDTQIQTELPQDRGDNNKLSKSIAVILKLNKVSNCLMPPNLNIALRDKL